MSVQSAYVHAKTFCSSLLKNSSNLKSEVETLVTLTYVQSLDGKISGNYGQQLTLSCEESMIITHRLRALHDGILLLEKAGAKVILIDSDQNGLLSINHLLSTLRSPPFSINCLMVEGGAKIIDSFLKSGKVDLLIVTITPILVGANGVFAIGNNNLVENNSEDKLPKLTNVTYEKFGRDIVLFANILNN
ncbi:GTP cyclohydrolase [Gigaspora margarita]|uniref:2,5-diamino-6-ribosylamino-4(3H)-pyrimidinone 5'-phosphate reductase n=1 Tax=Gigaspora margarita TaxID=4874 RepID=A0A8H4AHS1_GIGMA|nr:GTP cyclohydrolase [Gigaspora margarita]